MNRFILLVTPLLLSLLELHAADRPNVLFIIADDLKNSLGCYGDSVVQTPHLDRLATQGVRFERAYCQFPLCGPSRTSFMSGVWPAKTRVHGNEINVDALLDERSLMPQFFKQNGYRTARIGKVLHFPELESSAALWDYSVEGDGSDPVERRLQTKERVRNAAVKAGTAKDTAEENFLWAKAETEDACGDAVKATRAIAWLKEAAQSSQPFFLALGFRKPHHPYVAPARYFDLHPLDHIQWPAEPPDHIQGIPADALTVTAGSRTMTDHERRQIIRAYYACVSLVDSQVGRLMAALDETKLSHNTIVVFIGDHGYHLGEHRQAEGAMWHKMSLFDVVARCPLIIRDPRSTARGQVCDSAVQLLDIYPTLVERTGLTAAFDLDGHSLVSLLDNPAAEWPHPAFTFIRSKKTRLGTAVTHGDHRYFEWSKRRRGTQLYNLASDPHELENLSSDHDQNNIIERMRQFLSTVPAPY